MQQRRSVGSETAELEPRQPTVAIRIMVHQLGLGGEPLVHRDHGAADRRLHRHEGLGQLDHADRGTLRDHRADPLGPRHVDLTAGQMDAERGDAHPRHASLLEPRPHLMLDEVVQVVGKGEAADQQDRPAQQPSKCQWHRGRWRRGEGVEPSRQRMAPPTGFEARPTHQDRFLSMFLSMFFVIVPITLGARSPLGSSQSPGTASTRPAPDAHRPHGA